MILKKKEGPYFNIPTRTVSPKKYAFTKRIPTPTIPKEIIPNITRLKLTATLFFNISRNPLL